MSVNISSSQDSMLDQMTSLIFRGDADSALRVLEKSNLNSDQKAKIETILAQRSGGYAVETAQVMKLRMIAAITGQDASTSSIITSELPQDIMRLLFVRCISQCDLKTITALPCVNKLWKQSTIEFFVDNLTHTCAELTILDAKAQEKECNDEPAVNPFDLFKWTKKLAPHVENNAGVTLLTVTKDTTLNQLIEIAKKAGITIDIPWNRIIEEFGDVPVGQTYRTLVTNNIFSKSRGKDYNIQNDFVVGHGCEMPTVQDYVALCVYTPKIFNKCLYGQTPFTYGRSSMRVDEYPLVVGGSAPGRLYVGRRYGNEDSGAGGRRKF